MSPSKKSKGKKSYHKLLEKAPRRQYEPSKKLTLPTPLIPLDEIRDSADAEGFIEGLVEVALEEVLDEDSYGFEMLLAERLIGFKYHEKLYKLEYTLESCTPHTLLFRFKASADLVLKALDEEANS